MPTYLTHVHCSRCGKSVSGHDPEMGLVVRAWVECPECLDAEAEIQNPDFVRRLAEWHAFTAAIERDEALRTFHQQASTFLEGLLRTVR